MHSVFYKIFIKNIIFYINIHLLIFFVARNNCQKEKKALKMSQAFSYKKKKKGTSRGILISVKHYANE